MKGKRVGPVKAAVIKWLGLENAQGWPDSFGGVYSTSGEAVNERSVLQLSAAWACVRLISETISTLPLTIYKKEAGGGKPAPEHPLHFIIHDQPNNFTTAAVYWEAVVTSMLLRGVAYSEKLMIAGRLTGLRFLPRGRLTLPTETNKNYVYISDNGEPRDIPPYQIWRLDGWSLDGVNGVSVIEYGANVFGAAQSTDNAASATFKRGMMPTTWFKYPKLMKPDQRKDARDFIENRLSGQVNAGRPVILEADMEVGTLGIKPSDAQLLESRGFSVEEICRWFRVPPHMIGHTEKTTSWGTGIEQQMLGFLKFTLQPWLIRIEQSIKKELLAGGPDGVYYPKFIVEGLLRADSAARAEFYSKMVNNGIMTRDEVRGLEDRSPRGGNADVLTVHTALTTLDNLGAERAEGYTNEYGNN